MREYLAAPPEFDFHSFSFPSLNALGASQDEQDVCELEVSNPKLITL